MSFRDLEAAVLGITQSTFGVPVTYTPSVGSPVTLNGVFDNAYIEALGTSSLKPVLRINLSDLALAPARGDQVTIETVTYKITVCEADSYGGAILQLQKV